MKAFALALACGCSAAPHPETRSGDVAIANVTVLPMSSDGALEHRTVVIRGGRIAAIMPSTPSTERVGGTVIDGTGKWLMPGLADMHVHLWDADDLILYVAAGVTTIRNMWGVPQHLAWRDQIADGRLLGPTLVTAGPMLDGDPPDWPGSIVIASTGDAEAEVKKQREAGYDFLKSVGSMTREAYGAVTSAARRRGMPLAGHVTRAVGLDGALAAHQQSIEHLDGYLAGLVPPGVELPSDTEPVPWTRAVLAHLDRARLPPLIARTIAAGSWNCPTLVMYDRVFPAAGANAQLPWLDLVPVATRARWAYEARAGEVAPDDAALLHQSNTEVGAITAALVAANAPVLAGTDASVPYVIPGASLHAELELMIAAGVPRPAALRIATADASRYLGKPHEAGVIEVGARADLMLVSSDPRTTPLPLVPDGVMVRGRWLPRAELERMLAELRARRAQTEDPWPRRPLDPPLPAQLYDTSIDGVVIAQERVLRDHDIGDLIEHGRDVELHYGVGQNEVRLRATYHTMTLDLTAKLELGRLRIVGTDLTGRSVELQQILRSSVFFTAPGVVGANALLRYLGPLAVGATRSLNGLRLDAMPIAIIQIRYDVARKPDRDGRRVYAVTADGADASELIVDGDGIVSQTFADGRVTRRR